MSIHTKEQIKQAWEEVLVIHFHLLEKGIDEDGWYSNERNGQWFPIQGDDVKLYDFRNGNTEVRPKSLGLTMKESKAKSADERATEIIRRIPVNQANFDYISKRQFGINGSLAQDIKHAMKEYAEPLQSRISELEANNKALTDAYNNVIKNLESFAKCQHKDPETGEEHSGYQLAYAVRFAANAFLRDAEQALNKNDRLTHKED